MFLSKNHDKSYTAVFGGTLRIIRYQIYARRPTHKKLLYSERLGEDNGVKVLSTL